MLSSHIHKIIEVHRNGYVLQRCIVPGCHVCFKGGGSPDKPSSQMADTEIKKYARSELYPMVSRGLEGEGFGTPQTAAQQERTLYGGLDESFKTAKSDFDSQVSRTIDPADTRVRNYMSNELQRGYIRKKDDIARTLRSEKVADTDLSMGLAADYLAGEKRMAIGGAQMYNQALQQSISDQNRMGAFASNVAGGVASGASDWYYAQQMGQS